MDGGRTFETAPLPAFSSAPLPVIAAPELYGPRMCRADRLHGVRSRCHRRGGDSHLGLTPGARAEVAFHLVGTYANVFMLEPGRCFRFVENDGAHGQPVPCSNSMMVRGRWRDGASKLRVVEARAEQGVELEERRRVGR